MMMKSKLFLLLFAFCSVLLTGCKDDEPESTEATRTVLAYLASDNSLSGFALKDLAEMKIGMENIGRTNVHLLVYIDTGSSSRLVELKYKKGEVVEELIKEYGNRNSVGVEETKEVFNDAFFNADYKAKSYGLIYWSHGDGWIPNPLPSSRWIGQDTGDGTHYMNISDLVSILSSSAPHLDFIMFDACFMQSIEVAYALRNYTDYYLGSPTEIPGPGARYDVLVPALFADGNAAMSVAAAYYNPYAEIYDDGKGISNTNWTGGVSMCALKSSELEVLASTTRQVLAENLNSEVTDNEVLRSMVFDYDQRYGSYEVGYFDMVQMMELITDAAGFAVWKQAYDAAVCYWQTTPKNYSAIGGMFSMEGANGVSHYIPASSASAAKAYRSTDWYEAAGLSELGW